MPKILFRTTGSAQVGFGHVRRCWTLAAELQTKGAEVLFVVDRQEAADVLSKAGFEVLLEPAVESIETTLNALGSAAACVADDPALTQEQFEQLEAAAPVLAIDDTGDRVFLVSAVTNGSAAAERLEYQAPETTERLLGAQYILLRPGFAELSADTSNAKRFLILTGGGDTADLRDRLMAIVSKVQPEAVFDVVVGPFALEQAQSSSDTVTYHKAPEDLTGLMEAADIALTAAGQTAYELAASGVPAVGFLTAENQRINLTHLSEAGTLIQVGEVADADFEVRLQEAVELLVASEEKRQALSAAGRALVDGKGVSRIAEAVLALSKEKVA